MRCLVLKCGTGVGFSHDCSSPPRSTELYTKCLIPAWMDWSIRAMPCFISPSRVAPLPRETWTEYTPQIGVDPDTLFAAAKRLGTALRSPSTILINGDLAAKR